MCVCVNGGVGGGVGGEWMDVFVSLCGKVSLYVRVCETQDLDRVKNLTMVVVR